MKILKHTFGLIGLSILAFVACDPGPCPDSDGVTLNGGFYTATTYSVTDTLIDSLVILTDMVVDSVIYSNMGSTGTVELPLNANSTQTTLFFGYDSLYFDTITVFYEAELIMDNYQCGFTYFYNIDKIETTNYNIDSIRLNYRNIEYGETEHIKIFF